MFENPFEPMREDDQGMKYVRFEHAGAVACGLVEGDHIRVLEGNLFERPVVTNTVFSPSEVRMLAPVTPPNILAIGLNYKSHAAESNERLPDRPLIFLKATTALLGPEEAIVRPVIAPDAVDYEAELAVVIGKKAKDVPEEDVGQYILGYTCANDVSARDCQLKLDTQWARGKSFDTFCPLGPWIVTDLDTRSLNVESRVNGETLQKSNTRHMIFSVAQIVSYCSRNMTLLPGTVILTGTPEGVGFARKPPKFLKAGDVVEIEVEGIGVLRNTVR